jgi:hypothetical protein
MKKYGNASNPHSPIWGNAEKTCINLKVTIEGFGGEHEFSATSFDSEMHGVELFNDAAAGIFGTVQDYVPPSTEKIAAIARERRDALIATTDWTQNADIPQATKDKWAPYRQALRDVPQQAGFPDTIVWPTPPQ